MKTEELKALGDLAKARRIVALLDQIWDIIGDTTVFEKIPYKEVEAIEVPLMNARAAASNLMARLGDTSAMTMTPRFRRS